MCHASEVIYRWLITLNQDISMCRWHKACATQVRSFLYCFSLQDPRPAFFAKPLPAAVNPTVETELRQAESRISKNIDVFVGCLISLISLPQTALSTAWRALGALSGGFRFNDLHCLTHNSVFNI